MTSTALNYAPHSSTSRIESRFLFKQKYINAVYPIIFNGVSIGIPASISYLSFGKLLSMTNFNAIGLDLSKVS